MRTGHFLWRWYIIWGLALLLEVSIFVFYAGFPSDGATGDIGSFTPDGFRVQWLLERRAGGLEAGDVILRAEGRTVEDWLSGASPGTAWRTGGIVTYQILRNGQVLTLPISLRPVSVMAILSRWALQLIVIAVMLFTAAFVFWRRHTELSAQLFTLCCLMAAVHAWRDAYNFQYPILPGRWLFWGQFVLEQVTYSLAWSFVCHFFLIFPRPHPWLERFPRLLLALVYGAPWLTMLICMALSPTWRLAIEASNSAIIGMSLAQTALALSAIFRSMLTGREAVARAQARWIAWGALGPVVVIGVGYFLPAAVNAKPFMPHPFAVLGLIFIPLVMGIAVLRYRLWDIDLLINRSLVYGLLTTIMVGLYLLSVVLLQGAFRAITGETSEFALVGATLLIALAFQPLRQRLQSIVDRKFYREKVDFRRALQNFAREVRHYIDLPELLRVIVRRLTDLFHSTGGAVYLSQGDTDIFQLAEVCELASVDRTLPLAAGEVERLRSGEPVTRLGDRPFAVLVPLIAPHPDRRELIGVLTLGPKLSAMGYGHEDLALLTTLVDEAGTAISLAQAVAEKQRAMQDREAAEAAMQAKSVFLATMSHELRTPLNAILGYAQILRQRQLDHSTLDGLATIQNSGEHLLALINDLLDLSRIEAGALKLNLRRLHLPAFLEGVVGIIRSRAEIKNLKVVLEAPRTLPERVQIDETRLRQILLNLLGNAVKFTDTGQVTLRVQPGQGVALGIDDQPPPAWLRFEVDDTGVGIPPDHLDRIFRPFEQGSDAARHAEGTGLGLAISRHLVQLMGGDLYVQSEPGRGSRFWFEIAVPVDSASSLPAPSFARLPTGYRGPRRRVLVVDDVASSRAVVADMLLPLGFDILEATEGQQALQLAREAGPDLILMDRRMPVMSGREAGQYLRQMPALKGVPIIAMSASAPEDNQAQSLEAGYDAVLSKPIHWPHLAALLQTHLKLEWEYAPTEQGPSAELTPLTLPPQEELQFLLTQAQLGDMAAISKWAVQVEAQAGPHAAFAQELRLLAEEFEEREILALVKKLREGVAP